MGYMIYFLRITAIFPGTDHHKVFSELVDVSLGFDFGFYSQDNNYPCPI